MNESAAIIRPPEPESTDLPDASLPRPWGFWSSLGWAVLAFVLGAAIVGGAVLWLNWGHLDALPDTAEDPWFPLHFIVSNAIQVAVLAAAARWARWPVGRYLGLVAPRGSDLLHGLIALLVVMGALEILTHLLHRESVAPFQTESYRAARDAGLLPLLWLAFVVAAPVGEEVLFRGFLFRGWIASPLGVPGTILLTSCIFSAAHTQYDWFGVGQTFAIGALFAWLRWRSGSTVVTILLHMGVNFTATLWSAVKVEGLI